MNKIKSVIVALIVAAGHQLVGSEYDDLRAKLLGKYIIINDGVESVEGIEFTDESFILGTLKEIISGTPDKRLINGYFITKTETGNFFIIAHRAGDIRYDDGFRVEAINDGWNLFMSKGKEGDPGVIMLKLKKLHEPKK